MTAGVTLKKIVVTLLSITELLILSGCAVKVIEPYGFTRIQCDRKRYGAVNLVSWIGGNPSTPSNMAHLSLGDVYIDSVNGKPAKIGPPSKVIDHPETSSWEIIPLQDHFDYCNANFPVGKKIKLTVAPFILIDKGGNRTRILQEKSQPLIVTFDKGGIDYNLYNLEDTSDLGRKTLIKHPIIDEYVNGFKVIIASSATKLVGLSPEQAEIYIKATQDKKYSAKKLESMRQKMLKKTGYQAR